LNQKVIARRGIVAVAILLVSLVSSVACRADGAEPDHAESQEPTLTRLAATPVPFPFRGLPFDEQVKTLADLRARLISEIGENEAHEYMVKVRPDEEATVGAGYVHRVSRDALEIIIYPTGQTLRVDNAEFLEIRRNQTTISIRDLKPRELVSVLNTPRSPITVRAFGATWP
jgi:hypothetical protein